VVEQREKKETNFTSGGKRDEVERQIERKEIRRKERGERRS
jgi:hypothetical protein